MRTFEWDEEKAAANVARHGVTFREAQSVFKNPLSRVGADHDHSETEHREIIAGHSSAGRLLLVSFAERGAVIRLISARELTRSERRFYEEKEFPESR